MFELYREQVHHFLINLGLHLTGTGAAYGILFPLMLLLLHSEIQWGTASKWLRRVPLYVGIFFIGVVPPGDETGLGASGQVLDVDLIDLGRAASQVELPPELYRGVAAGLQLG